MVVTCCSTYNHAPYIVEAMNGFAMQETNFPVYYLITDDASTDGEPEVIKQYLADHFQTPYRTEETDDYYLICAVHKTNPNCNFIVFFLKYNHYSIKKPKRPYQAEWRENTKYIAICEGDDYWTDPMKLQIQAEFLDTHSDYSAVATQSTVIYESGDKSHPFSKHIIDYDWERGSLVGYRPFHTATIMYRPCAEIDNRPSVYSGDIAIMIILSQKGKVRLMSQCTSIYRKHSAGASSNVRLSDLQRDLSGIPYYLAINPNFPIRRYKAYLYYTFSTFPPSNGVCSILKYGIISIWYSLTCKPVSFYMSTKTAYSIFLKLKKKIQKNF